MFQLADHLVGIYKTNNRTKNVALSHSLLSRFEKFEQSLKASKEVKDKQSTDIENKVLIDNTPERKSNSDILQIAQQKNKSENDPFDELIQKSAEKTVTFAIDLEEEKENIISCDNNKS